VINAGLGDADIVAAMAGAVNRLADRIALVEDQ
jgi:hypothetical protein